MRLGIILPRLGIRSQIWAVRQACFFARATPVFFHWGEASEAEGGFLPLPEGLEAHRLPGAFPPPVTPLRRVARRLGQAYGVQPGRGELAAIGAALKGARLDAVLCHFAATSNVIVTALGGALPVFAPKGAPPVFAQVHGRDVTRFMDNPAYRAAVRASLPRLSGLIAVGCFQLDLLKPYGLPARTAVIPCGAPLETFSAASPPERAEGEPLRLITVGRLSPEKGVMETLEAFRVLSAQVSAEWTVVGDGELLQPLREALEKDPPAGPVHLRGALESAEVARALSAAHVFAQHARPHGGWIEGFGVTATEAGAAGLARVLSTLGGLADQATDEADALMHAPGDVAAQTAALLRLARDEPLRRRLGLAARARAAEFDAEALSRRLEDFVLEGIA